LNSTDQRLLLKTRAFALIVMLSNAFGNLFLTWGVRHSGELSSPLSYITVLFSPWVALGVLLLILWMLSKMALLSWADLTYVLPATSFGYVLNAFLGHYFLGEHISAGRWIGTALIVGGMVLVGLGSPHGESR